MRLSAIVRLAPILSAAVLGLFVSYNILEGNARAQGIDPDSVMELIESLEMTEGQRAKFQEQEALRVENAAKLKALRGEALQAARENFQAERKAALRELFTEEQWAKWDGYWTAFWNQDPEPAKPTKPPGIAKGGDSSDTKFEANGRFQIGKRNGRTTLITPEGEPFFSLGVTHIQAIAAPAPGEPDLVGNRFNGDWAAMISELNENLLRWGYNSTGYGTPRHLGEMMPYAEGVLTAPTSLYFGGKQFSYPDVFDPAWEQKVKQTLRFKFNAHKDNQNLLGVFWTDMPLWDLQYGKRSGKPNWVEVTRALPAEAPGRQRYEAFLTEYGDQATDEEFLRLIARHYYEVIGKETRRLLPDSIIFGERYGLGITPSFVVEEAAPWIDAIAIQPYGNRFQASEFDRLHGASGGKGILICDHNISFPTEAHPETMWTQLPTVEEVAQTHARYLDDALSRPYILGYHRCQYIDRFQPHLKVLKQGLIKSDGTPHEELVTLVAKTNKAVLERFAAETTMESAR